jgi:hypothetical protein
LPRRKPCAASQTHAHYPRCSSGWNTRLNRWSKATLLEAITATLERAEPDMLHYPL